MITVQKVRDFLKGLPTEFVGDVTIQTHIDNAYWEIDKEKSNATTQEDIDNTALLHASYNVTLAYMSEAERSLGVIPPTLTEVATGLHTRLEKAMVYIKRGSPTKVGPYVVSDSLWRYRKETVPSDS